MIKSSKTSLSMLAFGTAALSLAEISAAQDGVVFNADPSFVYTAVCTGPQPQGVPIGTTSGAIKARITARYLSVSGGIPGQNYALGVTLVDLAGSFSRYNGLRLFAKPSTLHSVSELPGRSAVASSFCFPDICAPPPCAPCGSRCVGGPLHDQVCDPNADPDPCATPDPNFSTGRCVPGSFMVVELGCDADPAEDFRDWTVNPFDAADPNPIYHIKSEWIIPSSTYEIGFVHESCDALDQRSFGDGGVGLLTLTTAKWMDSNELQDGLHLQPGGVVSTFDIVGMLEGFGGVLTRMEMVRIDAVGVTTAGTVPFVDGAITASDLTRVLDAFSGYDTDYPRDLGPHCEFDYPFGPYECVFGPDPGILCVDDLDCFTPICP